MLVPFPFTLTIQLPTQIITLTCSVDIVCPQDTVDSQETETLIGLPYLASLIVLTAKNFFRVSDRTGGQLQSHCFQASDAFNKQQWINCIRQAKEAAALAGGQTDLGGQIGPVLTPRSDLRQDSERAVWGETDSGRCLEAEASPSGERGVILGQESRADEGMSVETEARVGEDADPDTSSQTGEGVLDKAVGVWKMDRGGVDAHGGAAADISASSRQEEDEREAMEQSGAEREEEVGMDTSEVTSPRREDLTHRC